MVVDSCSWVTLGWVSAVPCPAAAADGVAGGGRGAAAGPAAAGV